MPKNDKSITNAELAIMSLLVEQPMHGYQIEQTIEDRGMREWTSIGFSSIYYILDKLKKLGWLEFRVAANEGQGPARRIFSLTSTGKKKWKLSILLALSHPSSVNNVFLLGLSNLGNLEKFQVVHALENYLFELKIKYDHLAERQNDQSAFLPWNVSAMFDHSLKAINSELEWLKEFVEMVKLRKD